MQDKHRNLRHKFLVKSNNVGWYLYGIFLWFQDLRYITRNLSKYKFTFSFHRKNKEMDSENCPCKVCKYYVKTFGFCNIADGI